MRFNALDDWLRWLENLHPTAIDLGLSRVANVASTMKLARPAKRVVTVAGTNGKGSCAAVLESILIGAGQRVGIYTSPHLIHYCERVRLLGVPVAEDLMCDALAAVDQARGSTTLTYFEFGTLAALKIFETAKLDVVVLEVGLGGRLDAVNIVDPDIAVITSIALDHQDWLGNDRESIGYEKAGIIRQAMPVVCSDYSPPASVLARCQESDAKWYGIGEQFDISEQFEIGEQENKFAWYGLDCDAKSIAIALHDRPRLPEPSVAAALQVVQLLGLDLVPSQEEVAQGVANAVLAGRYQQVCQSGIDIVLDVAHNPAAAQMLAERLSQQLCKGKTVAVFSMLIDKDIAAVIDALDTKICISQWYIAEIKDIPRSASLTDLERLFDSRAERSPVDDGGVMSCQNLSEAFVRAKGDCHSGDRILVFGSFYTVAEILCSQADMIRPPVCIS